MIKNDFRHNQNCVHCSEPANYNYLINGQYILMELQILMRVFQLALGCK